MSVIDANESLDLQGVPCPQNAARTMMKLALMDAGEVLEVIVDDGEPYENVPESIRADDESVIEAEKQDEQGAWHIFVRRL